MTWFHGVNCRNQLNYMLNSLLEKVYEAKKKLSKWCKNRYFSELINCYNFLSKTLKIPWSYF